LAAAAVDFAAECGKASGGSGFLADTSTIKDSCVAAFANPVRKSCRLIAEASIADEKQQSILDIGDKEKQLVAWFIASPPSDLDPLWDAPRLGPLNARTHFAVCQDMFASRGVADLCMDVVDSSFTDAQRKDFDECASTGRRLVDLKPLPWKAEDDGTKRIVTRAKVRIGHEVIRSITFWFTNNEVHLFGESGTVTSSEFSLEKGEYLTKVSGMATSSATWTFKFTTNTGRESPVYSSGKPIPADAKAYSFLVVPGKAIVGFQIVANVEHMIIHGLVQEEAPAQEDLEAQGKGQLGAGSISGPGGGVLPPPPPPPPPSTGDDTQDPNTDGTGGDSPSGNDADTGNDPDAGNDPDTANDPDTGNDQDPNADGTGDNSPNNPNDDLNPNIVPQEDDETACRERLRSEVAASMSLDLRSELKRCRFFFPPGADRGCAAIATGSAGQREEEIEAKCADAESYLKCMRTVSLLYAGLATPEEMEMLHKCQDAFKDSSACVKKDVREAMNKKNAGALAAMDAECKDKEEICMAKKYSAFFARMEHSAQAALLDTCS